MYRFGFNRKNTWLYNISFKSFDTNCAYFSLPVCAIFDDTNYLRYAYYWSSASPPTEVGEGNRGPIEVMADIKTIEYFGYWKSYEKIQRQNDQIVHLFPII